jgi:hypothetical protein
MDASGECPAMAVPRLFSIAGLLLGLNTTGMLADALNQHEHYSPMDKIITREFRVKVS